MKQNINEKIKELREKNGWSQSELAEKSGISTSAISQFESGGRTPSAPILRKLATTLNTTIDYLLGIQTSANDANDKAFYRNFQELDENSKALILNQIEFLKNQNKQKK